MQYDIGIITFAGFKVCYYIDIYNNGTTNRIKFFSFGKLQQFIKTLN